MNNNPNTYLRDQPCTTTLPQHLTPPLAATVARVADGSAGGSDGVYKVVQRVIQQEGRRNMENIVADRSNHQLQPSPSSVLLFPAFKHVIRMVIGGSRRGSGSFRRNLLGSPSSRRFWPHLHDSLDDRNNSRTPTSSRRLIDVAVKGESNFAHPLFLPAGSLSLSRIWWLTAGGGRSKRVTGAGGRGFIRWYDCG